jgi:hypothetical protein
MDTTKIVYYDKFNDNHIYNVSRLNKRYKFIPESSFYKIADIESLPEYREFNIPVSLPSKTKKGLSNVVKRLNTRYFYDPIYLIRINNKKECFYNNYKGDFLKEGVPIDNVIKNLIGKPIKFKEDVDKHSKDECCLISHIELHNNVVYIGVNDDTNLYLMSVYY